MASISTHSPGLPVLLPAWLRIGLRTLQERHRLAAERRRRYRQTVRELSICSDRELADIGIPRYDIHRVAREAMDLAREV